MFARFGRLKEANHIFRQVAKPSVYTWSAIVLANAVLGNSVKALQLYSYMMEGDLEPDSHTFVAVLMACTNGEELMDGMLVHTHVIECGLESMPYIASGLILLYASFSRLADAQLVYDRQEKPSVVLLSELIHGYAENDCFADAIVLFRRMQLAGVEINEITCVCMVKACASARAIKEGMKTHFLMVEMRGIELQSVTRTSLVYMYGQFGMMQDARKIFRESREHDILEWNALIAGEAQHSCVIEVLQLYNQMQQHGVEPNQITFTCILKACAIANVLTTGKEFHAYLVGRNLQMDVVLTNALLNIYARSGDIQNTFKLFKLMEKRNVATWTIVITACAENGYRDAAFQLFELMLKEGMIPNNMTFLSILSACSHIAELKLIHSCIIDLHSELDATLVSCLIRRHGEFSSLLDSLNIFEQLIDCDIVTWNAIITVHAQHGCQDEALSLFIRMQMEGFKPDYITYSVMIPLTARKGLLLEVLYLFGQMLLHDIQSDANIFSFTLQGCSNLGTPDAGNVIYGHVIESGQELDAEIGAAIVYMYMSYGAEDDAEHIFDRFGHGYIEIWNAMMSGYVRTACAMDELSIEEHMSYSRDQHTERIFQLYNAMNQEGISPNQATFVMLLKSCYLTTASDHGKKVHAHIVEAGLDEDLLVGNMLIQMYTELKSYKDAICVFESLHQRNVVTFNTMLTAWAQQSCLELVKDGFQLMQQEGLKADEVTVLSLLSACSHIGKEIDALRYFNKMQIQCGIEPTHTHYTCIADLVSRNGYLKEGHDLLRTMPFLPNSLGLSSLSTHSAIHGSL
ncbi:hypothetical protein KP509_19G061300 [Ceratopteris richardii]|nr:hypothetical protein KP509_19G061300 [Ceratopteris richardii]